MSTNLAYSLTAPAPAAAPERRGHIEIVSTGAQRRARPRVVYALVTVAGIFAILMAQLLLSIAIADSSYQIAARQGALREASRDEQALSEKLNMLNSTQNLAANAGALGMVSSTNFAYLDLASGQVLGTPGSAAPGGGTLIGASGSLVPNSLLAGVPVVGPQPDAGAPADAATPGAPAAATTTQAPVASTPSGLPAPVTR